MRVDIVHEGNHVPAYIHSQRVGLYKIDFTPQGAGSYTVHVYFNDNEVRGKIYIATTTDTHREREREFHVNKIMLSFTWVNIVLSEKFKFTKKH